jgi:hypothetical protein
VVTARADQLARADRRRLLERLADAGDLDRLMRERGTLAPAPEPPPLHRAARDTTTERTSSS